MSTGIVISSAIYGAGSTTVDVTPTVAGLVKDGDLRFTVSATTLNVTDPAPGQLKELNISYTVNGGSTNTSSVKDGGLVSISAPPQTVADGLQITKAEYGYAGNFQDVTDAIQNLVSNGSINLKVGFAAVGLPDPNPAKKKSLKVEYTINGAKNTEVLDDGKTLKLSAPSVSSPSNSSPSQNVTSFFGSVFRAVYIFIGTFLHFLSVFLTYRVCGAYSSMLGYFGGVVAMIIPFFGFIVLPSIIFTIRLFTSEDIVVI
jgi:hypothetical protein